MTAGAAEPSPPLSSMAMDMAIPDVEYVVPPQGADNALYAPSSPRTFKKHRNLPHPPNARGSTNGALGTLDSRRSSSGSASQRYTNPLLFELPLPANGSSSHVASLHTLRHQRRRISGGELPPTPPAHSRTSSSSKSISLSNISPLQTPAQSSEDVQTQNSPSTPVNQRSPPTPEVTPPRSKVRSSLAPERPALPRRIPSKTTTRTDSRTESFRTALESPEVSEEDENDSNPTVRAGPSTRASEVTVLRLNGDETKSAKRAGSSVDIASKHGHEPHNLTPRADKGTSGFYSFDGEWCADGEVEQEWDDNLARTVTVKKRHYRSPQSNGQRHEVVDDRTIMPTNAIKAVRKLPLQGRILTYDPPETTRNFTAPEPAIVETPGRTDARRRSGMSAKSTASTTVEAILVETQTVRRNKTLRHVKRVDALRDAVWQSPPRSSPWSSSLSSVPVAESANQSRRTTQAREVPRESYASNSTVTSTSSRKARKEVSKSGAVPVAVVPDRHSSTESSSQDRSAPSTSSQRSRLNHSINRVPLSQVPKSFDLTPYFDRPPRRGRRTSESDGCLPGDKRTIDFPPVVPLRSSSLSAPTSRSGSRRASINGSHAGSLTAESLKAHNDSVLALEKAKVRGHAAAGAVSSSTEASVPTVTIDSVPSYAQIKHHEQHYEAVEHRPKVDSLIGSPRLPTQTPFSSASIETSGTNAEIALAMAMSIDRHQNRSVLMVDHRPSESSDGERRPSRPIVTTDAQEPAIIAKEITAEEEPITPPQALPPFSLNDVDSPLRNPRDPPDPPALQFIPATPSGLTPADERPRLLGNFYDEVEREEKRSRGLAMVRRALSKRRNSYGPSSSRENPGFLARTLSFSRNIRKETAENPDADQFGGSDYDEPSYDESHLHPDWRPSYDPELYGDGVFDVADEGEEPRYPMIDNRPRPPKRTLSERMKNTFAIMPVRNSYHDEYIHDDEPERRTICRDHNGSLRVVKKRGSVGSLRNRREKVASQRTPVFPRKFQSFAKLRRRESEDSETGSMESNGLTLKRTWSLTNSVQGLSRRLSERRREKRSNELRGKISAPRDYRDGVEDILKSNGLREAYEEPRRLAVRV